MTGNFFMPLRKPGLLTLGKNKINFAFCSQLICIFVGKTLNPDDDL